MDASFHIRPFAFDRIFTAAAAAHPLAAEDLQLQVASLEAELERLRAEHEAMIALARADSFEAGLAQAREERETALLTAVDCLQASLEEADQRIDEIARGMEQDAAGLALAAAELLAGRELRSAPGEAIDLAIGRVLKQVARGQEIVVRVHPDLAAEIERLVAARQAGDRRRLNLHVAPDESIALGDARLEWDQGGLSLDAESRSEAIREELEGLLPPV